MVPGPIYSRFAADPMLGELVDLFVMEMPDRIRALDAHFKNREWKELERVAHQLKGAAGSYGFDAVTSPAAQLEAALRFAEPEQNVLLALDELLGLCGRLRAGVPAA